MTIVITLLTIQALLGLADNVINHELKLGLASRRSARNEMALHGLRHLLYAVLFAGIAWFEWRGAYAATLGGVLAAEFIITVLDFLEEDRTRSPLPPAERVLHTVLTVLYGAFVGFFAPILWLWWQQPTALEPVRYGLMTPVFTLFAVGVAAWGVRDLSAALASWRAPAWWRAPLVVGRADGRGAVLVTGATGFIGRHLVGALVAGGRDVIVWSTDRERAVHRFGPYAVVVEQLAEVPDSRHVDAVVNLAGAPVLPVPWLRARRAALLRSRVRTTRELVAWMRRRRRRPAVLVSASAVGLYGARDDDMALDERAPRAAGFQSRLTRAWEAAAYRAAGAGVRVCTLRFGLVLGRDGGSYPRLTAPLRLGAGMVLGSGRQWLSWIHLDDAIGLVLRALDDGSLAGPVNAVAPAPVSHAQFMRAAARRLRRPLWGRLPAWWLRAALGEMATLLVDGQRVVPARALASGYRFAYVSIDAALDALEAAPAAPRTMEVFYNGACQVCAHEMRRYRAVMAHDRHLTFVDVFLRAGVLRDHALGFGHLESRLHVRLDGERVVTGMDAVRALWDRMPGYRLAARASRAPGLRLVLDSGYDAIVAPLMTWMGRRHCGAFGCMRGRRPAHRDTG